MKLLKSLKFELPKLFFITKREEIKDIPIGVPFIFGDEKIEEYLVRLLEYEILFRAAKKTGYPFNFKAILTENGYKDITDFWWNETVYMDYVTEDIIESDDPLKETKRLNRSSNGSALFHDFVRDSSCTVDIDVLKSLKVFPVWLNKIEDAISTNIHNFAVFNPQMYNKKLEGMYGGVDLTSPPKNLIIIDISGSIPKAVSTTCLTLAKNLSETFYTDLLITGSKSTLYPYEMIHSLDVTTVYEENGIDNDQTYFKNLVSLEKKIYKTCIVFGDNHSPCHAWSNDFNKKTRSISRIDGKKLCKWEIEKLISFHTTSKNEIAGYADWFSPEKIEKISDWVTYLN